MKPQRRIRAVITWGLLLAPLWLAGTAATGQALRTNGYVTLQEGRVYVVTENRSAVVQRPLALTPELTLLTNGLIKVTGEKPERLAEGRKLSLDGFWVGDDGTLLAFKPHYLMKERVLFFVQRGVLTRVEHEVTFSHGTILRTDGTLLAPGYRLIRLQDGQRLGLNGETIPALDQVAMVHGSLVLQKDGSIVPLPMTSRIGMSDGTIVSGNGLITKPNGEQLVLSDGQRLTVEGAAMPSIQ